MIFAAMTGLQDFKGNSHTLNDYKGKGKWTIVMMWASDCHVCNQEAHQYVDFHKKHQSTDATVLGISLDGAEKKTDAEGFLKKHNLNFPNLIGEPNDVAAVFSDLTGDSFRGTPTFLIFSPDGDLRAQQVGAVPTDLIEQFMVSETKLIEQEKAAKNASK
jgi:peroxiredoxin